ncbi:albusnodin family lasso peptide [Actinoalloteichus spitiensis]|nr:albusnodin family lasso peptide [Actinoalloteichus spitiensis]
MDQIQPEQVPDELFVLGDVVDLTEGEGFDRSENKRNIYN